MDKVRPSFKLGIVTRSVIKSLLLVTTFSNGSMLCKAGLELAWVPMVPGTRRIFRQYCLAPANFGNFTT